MALFIKSLSVIWRGRVRIVDCACERGRQKRVLSDLVQRSIIKCIYSFQFRLSFVQSANSPCALRNITFQVSGYSEPFPDCRGNHVHIQPINTTSQNRHDFIYESLRRVHDILAWPRDDDWCKVETKPLASLDLTVFKRSF